MSKIKDLVIDQMNAVKHHPILFSTPMVKAIMEGRKTMTRRKVKEDFAVIKDFNFPDVNFKNSHENVWKVYSDQQGFNPTFKCPYGKIGDILWVRETWAYKGSTKFIAYKANADERVLPLMGKWKPSIHMPKAACRIFLEITNIRVERLDNITRKDAIAEGVEHWVEKWCGETRFKWYGKDHLTKCGFWDNDHFKALGGVSAPVASFNSLWAEINGFESLNANPWVWVIEFKRIEEPNNF